MTDLAAGRVAPFGDPGITACLQLPQAYRSLPRPSSTPCAKASTVRPYALDLTTGVSVLIPRHYNTPLVSCQRARKQNVECRMSKFEIGYWTLYIQNLMFEV